MFQSLTYQDIVLIMFLKNFLTVVPSSYTGLGEWIFDKNKKKIQNNLRKYLKYIFCDSEIILIISQSHF